MSGTGGEGNGHVVLIASPSDFTRGLLEAFLHAPAWQLRQVYSVRQADCALDQNGDRRGVLVIDAALLDGGQDGDWDRLLGRRADLPSVRLRASGDGEPADAASSTGLLVDAEDSDGLLSAVRRAFAEGETGREDMEDCHVHTHPTASDLPRFVAHVLGFPEDQVALSSSLDEDLGLDRFDVAELVGELEQLLDVIIPDPAESPWRTVGDLARDLQGAARPSQACDPTPVYDHGESCSA